MVNMTISSTNVLIMSTKDVIKETLVITKSSASSNYDDLNHNLLWQNNKPSEPELIIQTCSETNHFPLSSLVLLQLDNDSWNIFLPRLQRINIVLLLENAINRSSSEKDFQPVTPLHSPLPLILRNPFFDIFL